MRSIALAIAFGICVGAALYVGDEVAAPLIWILALFILLELLIT